MLCFKYSSFTFYQVCQFLFKTDGWSRSEMTMLLAADQVGSCSARQDHLQYAGGDRNITTVGECLPGTQWLIPLSYCFLSYSATMRRPGAPSLPQWPKLEHTHTLMTNLPRSGESREGPIISVDRCIFCPRHYRSPPCKQLEHGPLCHLTTHQHLSKTICREWSWMRIVKLH